MKAFSILLAFIPLFRMLWILTRYGESNPSNDEILFVGMLDRILQNSTSWSHFFRETLFSGPINALPTLVKIGLTYFTNNIFTAALYLGWGLAVLKLFLLYFAMTRHIQNPARWVLLPVLSALIFSPSQISTFEFSFLTLSEGLTQLGLALGVWSLVRFPGNWKGIGGMALGGMIASTSSLGGLFVWPVFLMGLILLHDRKIFHYLTWVLLTAMFCLPSFLSLGKTSFSFSNLLSPLMISSIGFPFAQNFSLETAQGRGWIGFGFLIAGVLLAILSRKTPKDVFAPSWMVLFFSSWAIFKNRLFGEGLAPWFASPYMLFWVGLAGWAYGIWVLDAQRRQGKTFFRKIFHFSSLGCLGFFGVLLYFYFSSNLTWADKSFYLRARSPAAASCLRHYKTAPTYCEQAVFLWEKGRYPLLAELAAPLERHRLSVFGPKETWSLQGDFILNKVRVFEPSGTSGVFWTPDRNLSRALFSDYRHLNLILPSLGSVEWTLTLPAQAKDAVFHTAVALGPSASSEAPPSESIFEMFLEPAGKPPRIVASRLLTPGRREWEPIQVSLSRYAGQKVTLRFFSKPSGSSEGNPILLRFPSLKLQLNEDEKKVVEENVLLHPSNTNLSPEFPKITPDDFLLTLKDSSESLNLCLNDYSHLYFKVAVPPDFRLKAAQIDFQMEGAGNNAQTIWVPLLGDGLPHEYTYDLKLLEGEGLRRLSRVKIALLDKEGAVGKGGIEVSEVRLIRRNKDTVCKN